MLCEVVLCKEGPQALLNKTPVTSKGRRPLGNSTPIIGALPCAVRYVRAAGPYIITRPVIGAAGPYN